MSTVHDPAVPSVEEARRDLTGYSLVAGCFILVGLSGVLVSWAHAPSSVLLVLRLVIAAAVLGVVFARRRPFRTFLRRDLWPRFMLMGLLDGGSLLAYFYAIRTSGVAVATFLLFVQPVWVALLAPRLLKAPTEKLVYLSLGVALAGLAVILAPGFTGHVSLSAAGVAAGLAAGVLYAFFQLLVKDLTRQLPSTTIVTLECTLDAVVILPLAAWQFIALDVTLTSRDWTAALVLGLVCTALAYSVWVEGVGRIPVQHSSILGFLTPVVAPLFAWMLLGERIAPVIAVGGAMILVGGALVVLYGNPEMEPEPPL